MKKIMILAFLFVVLFGCVQPAKEGQLMTDDLRDLVSSDDDVEVQIVYVNKDTILGQIDVLNKVCNGSIEEQGYYKIRKRSLMDDTSDVYYVDTSTNEVICKLKALIKAPEKEVDAEESEAVTNNETEIIPDETVEISLEKAKNLLVSYVSIDDVRLYTKSKTVLDGIYAGDDVQIAFKLYARQEFNGLKARFILKYLNGSEVLIEDISLASHEVDESYVDDFYIDIPDGNEEEYTLVLELSDNEDMIHYKEYKFVVEVKAASVQLLSLDPSPRGEVTAGRVLSIDVELENGGNDAANDLEIIAEIKELDLVDNMVVEKLASDRISTYELFFRIPADTDEDSYTVDVKVLNEDGNLIDEDNFRIGIVE